MSNFNQSKTTWVLVWDGTSKQVIDVVPPGEVTNTDENLQEFSTQDELNQFIQDNNLIPNQGQ
jgi:hypothetical protein